MNYFILLLYKKMKTGKIIMFTSLWALGIASLFMMGSSNASFGNFGNQDKAPMAQAETYQEFTEQTVWTRMEGKITEEQFNEMKEKHANREQNREAIEAAIQNHDYKAWAELHEGMDMLEKIDTEAKFEKLIEMHAIMEDARSNMDTAREKADAIAEELWIERWMGQKIWWGMWEWKWMWMKKWNNQEGWLGMNK